MTMGNKKELSPEQREELIRALKARFEKNMIRHKGLEWAKLQSKLDPPAGGEKLWSLNEMERTGGEPDVVGHDRKTSEYIFYDCSAESPKGRRNVCYDREGQEAVAPHLTVVIEPPPKAPSWVVGLAASGAREVVAVSDS